MPAYTNLLGIQTYDKVEGQPITQVKCSSPNPPFEFDRYNYYFIKHYDPSKTSKIRWCPISFKNLAHVTVLDYRYYQFENLIKRYLGVIINYDNNNSISEYYQKSEILVSAYELLQKIGFKKAHIHDKIKSNMLYLVDSSK
jgi:hypothetical protein